MTKVDHFMMDQIGVLRLLPQEKLRQFRHPSDPEDHDLIWRYRQHLVESSDVWVWISLIETALAKSLSYELANRFGQNWLNSPEFKKCMGSDIDAFRLKGGKLKLSRLTFGFWTTLIQDNKEKTFWVPTLNKAFIPGSSRKEIHKSAREIRLVRNKLAHHEILQKVAIEKLKVSIDFLANSLAEGFSEFVFLTKPEVLTKPR